MKCDRCGEHIRAGEEMELYGGNRMCQASVYLDQKKIMEDVIWLEPTQDGILVRTFFEEPQVIQGVLQAVDLLKHRVMLSSQQSLTKEGDKS
jgi:predicted RNA-binding protein